MKLRCDDMKYKCCVPGCPGYPYPASTLRHQCKESEGKKMKCGDCEYFALLQDQNVDGNLGKCKTQDSITWQSHEACLAGMEIQSLRRQIAELKKGGE